MNFYFAFDEYTDIANKEEAMKIASDVMEIFKDTETPSNNKITEMTRQSVFSLSWKGVSTA